MSFTRQYGTLTAALVLSLGTTAVTLAQQVPRYAINDSAGIVRITDGQIQPNGQRIQQAGAFHGHMSGGYGTGVDPNGNCPTGNCPTGNCPTGNYGTAGHFHLGLCPHCQGSACRFCEHYCTHSPGYGYTPPAKYPLLRRGVQYDAYYPAQWYGAGGEFVQSSAPMVYQPTDTTQLGFYYKHVPFWQPNPNPLPERPIPAQWHISPAPVRAYGYSYGWRYYGHGGHLLHRHRAANYQNGYDMTGACPVDGSLAPQQASPPSVVPPNQSSPTPVSPDALPVEPESSQELPQTSLPPTPTWSDDDGGIVPRPALPADSASSGHIKRL